MKKQAPVYDYENNLEPDLLRFLVRVEALEQESKDRSAFMNMRELEWDTHISEIKREIHIFKNQVSDLKRRVENFKSVFLSNVREFKLKADKDDLRKLENNVDRMNFENLITKDEFLRKSSFKWFDSYF